MHISRVGESKFLNDLVQEIIVKKSFSIERISCGKKKDILAGRVDGNVWNIKGNKLFRRRRTK